MNNGEIKQKSEEIEKIHQEYMGKIAELRKEQNRLLDDFTSKLEKEKKNEIMSKIRT